MEPKGKTAKFLAVFGALIVSAPIILSLVIGVIHSIRIGRLQIDFLMPAELFPVELCGALMLLAAALLTRSHVKPIAWSFGISIASLIASMCIAVATGLASGETAGGWAMALTTLMFVLYILALLVLVVAGVRLAIKLFSAK